MTPDPNTGPLTGSAARALGLLDLVLAHGPVTPARLTELSGLSRTAVHRGIHALIDQGFVRYQLGKAHVIVTARLQARMEGAFFSAPRIDAISRAIDAGLKGRRIHCDLGVLEIDGSFQIAESTAPEAHEDDHPLDNDLFSVLLSQFDPVDVTRITARVLRESGEDMAVSPEYLDRYRQAQYQGFLWNPVFGTLCVRLAGSDQASFAIRLSSRVERHLRRKDGAEALAAMHNIAPDIFPSPENMAD